MEYNVYIGGVSGAWVDPQSWKMGSSFFSYWHFICKFSTIFNEMEFQDELSLKIASFFLTTPKQADQEKKTVTVWVSL